LSVSCIIYRRAKKRSLSIRIVHLPLRACRLFFPIYDKHAESGPPNFEHRPPPPPRVPTGQDMSDSSAFPVDGTASVDILALMDARRLRSRDPRHRRRRCTKQTGRSPWSARRCARHRNRMRRFQFQSVVRIPAMGNRIRVRLAHNAQRSARNTPFARRLRPAAPRALRYVQLFALCVANKRNRSGPASRTVIDLV
jgi:hypothetical protein